MATLLGDDGAETMGVPRPDCFAGLSSVTVCFGDHVVVTLSMKEAEELLSELAAEMVEARRLATIPRPWLTPRALSHDAVQ